MFSSPMDSARNLTTLRRKPPSEINRLTISSISRVMSSLPGRPSQGRFLYSYPHIRTIGAKTIDAVISTVFKKYRKKNVTWRYVLYLWRTVLRGCTRRLFFRRQNNARKGLYAMRLAIEGTADHVEVEECRLSLHQGRKGGKVRVRQRGKAASPFQAGSMH